jgi:hypothetical protein
MNPVAPCSNPVRNSNGSSRAGGGDRSPNKSGKNGLDPSTSSLSWPRWTLPDIVEGGDDGLCDVAVETLSSCLHPVLEGLAALDAEVLLELRRRQPQHRTGGDGGGPVVREGYEKSWVFFGGPSCVPRVRVGTRMSLTPRFLPPFPITHSKNDDDAEFRSVRSTTTLSLPQTIPARSATCT